MNHKNTSKIKIKNDKIIVEAGTEYGAFLDDVKSIGKAVMDQYKGIGTLVKSAWQNTIGLSWKLYKNIKREGGIIKGLDKTTKWVAGENQKAISNLDTLIAAQPGAADASTFLNLTAPGLNTLNLITQKSGEILKDKVVDARDEDKYKDDRIKVIKKRAEIAYHNLIMAVYSLRGEDLSTIIRKNISISSSLQSEDLAAEISIGGLGKGTNKLVLLKYIEKASKPDKVTDFKEILKVISKYYKLDQENREKLRDRVYSKDSEEAKKKRRRELSILSDPGQEVEAVLDSFIDGAGYEAIEKLIIEKEVWVSLNTFSSRLCDSTLKKSILDAYDILLQVKESKSYSRKDFLSSTLVIRGNDLVLEKKALSNEEFFIKKTSRLIHDYLKYSKVYYLCHAKTYIDLTLMNAIVKLNHYSLKELVTKEDTTNDIESIKVNISTRILPIIKETNDIATKYNKEYQSNYELIKGDLIKQIISFKSQGMKNSNQTLDKIKQPNQKELVKSESLLDMINKYGTQFKSLDYTSEVLKIVKSNNQIENMFKNEIFAKYKNELKDIDFVKILETVDPDYKKYYNKGRKYHSQIKFIAKAIADSEEALAGFNNKKSELESLIEKLKVEAEKEFQESSEEEEESK
jgi:hypothetical protein